MKKLEKELRVLRSQAGGEMATSLEPLPEEGIEEDRGGHDDEGGLSP